MVSPVSAKVISQLHKTEEKYMFVCTVRYIYTVQWYVWIWSVCVCVFACLCVWVGRCLPDVNTETIQLSVDEPLDSVSGHEALWRCNERSHHPDPAAHTHTHTHTHTQAHAHAHTRIHIHRHIYKSCRNRGMVSIYSHNRKYWFCEKRRVGIVTLTLVGQNT